MYMFGGVGETHGPGAVGSPSAPKGFATAALFECDPESGGCEDISFGCTYATPASYKLASQNATFPRPNSGGELFTPARLGPRYGHALVATDTNVFVHGGAAEGAGGRAGLAGSADGVFAFSPAACAWREAAPVGAHLEAPGAARTEHAAAVLGDGQTLMLAGGRAGGDYSTPPLLLHV